MDVEQLKKEVGEVILQAVKSGDQDFLSLGSWFDKVSEIRTRKVLAGKSFKKWIIPGKAADLHLLMNNRDMWSFISGY